MLLLDPESLDNSGFPELLEAAKKVSPELYKKLQQRYHEDREDFVNFVKSNTKSTNPRDFAKKCCKNCNSKGIITFVGGNTSICACATKNYSKWIKHLRVEYNTLRGRKT